MKTMIIGNGEINDYDIIREYFDDAYIIACDGGIRHCRAMMIMPNVMVGDFDSANKEDADFFDNLGVLKIEYPVKKDKTDMEIAIDLAIEKNSDEIYIVGGLGSRFDHSLANVHILLRPVRLGIRACLLDEHNIITLVEDSIDIVGEKGQTVSLIPLTTKVNGITTENLDYILNNDTMEIGHSLGVSNTMTTDTATVSVCEGILILIMSRDWVFLHTLLLKE